MKLSLAAILLPLAASAAVLPRQAQSDEDWGVYDGETSALKDGGLCRYYFNRQPPARAIGGYRMCQDFCASAKDIIEPGKIPNTNCLGEEAPGVPQSHDPDGGSYIVGQCKCNLEIVSVAVGSFVEALPAVGHVTCAVWKKAIADAAKLLATGPTPWAPASASQVLFKTAKMLRQVGKGANEYEEWVRRVSADEGACDFSPKQLFEDFTKISDEDIANVM